MERYGERSLHHRRMVGHERRFVPLGEWERCGSAERCGSRGMLRLTGNAAAPAERCGERSLQVSKMNHDDILFLIQYHNRANAKIFETAAKLSQEQLMRPGEFDHDSAFQSLRHMLDVDWSWRQLCSGNDIGHTYLWDVTPMTNFDEIYAAWAKDSAELLAYAHALDDEALRQPVVINRERGETVPVWKVLAHVVNHGTQHRSELARYFTNCGYSPGDLDLL